jgi:predicted deacylase
MQDDLTRFPILGTRERGTTRSVEVALGGGELAHGKWTVTVVTGARPGPALLVTAGVHGAEYPGIQAAIELGRAVDPAELRGTLAIVPVVNIDAFWQRAMFVCPADGKNLNRQL